MARRFGLAMGAEVGLLGIVQHLMDIDRTEDAALFIANLDAGVFQRAVLGNLLARHVPGGGHGLGLGPVQIGALGSLMVGNDLAIVDNVEKEPGHCSLREITYHN